MIAAPVQDISVPVAFRELVLSRYEALRYHPKALVYRRMAQHFLFSSFFDEDTGELVLPRDLLAEIVGERAESHHFVVARRLEEFSRDVFPVRNLGYSYRDRKATCIRPVIAEEIMRAKFEMPPIGEKKVGFVTGRVINRHHPGIDPQAREAVMRGRVEEYLKTVDTSHPVRGLAEYLNNNHGCQVLTQKRNRCRVEECIYALPHTTESEACCKDFCIRVLHELGEGQKIFYAGSPNTPRLSAFGNSVHLLPRDFRQLYLSGPNVWECDLKSSQLAVVAKLWAIPKLQKFLEDALKPGGRSIWDELAGTAGLPLETCKPILKATIYSIVFGMGREKLLQQLAYGKDGKQGIGGERASLVLKHPLIREILKKRREQMRIIKEGKGAFDAWDRWHHAGWNDKRNDFDIPSLLAYVVQSWEMRVMLAMLPVLKAEKNINCLSWLHDGVTLQLGDSTWESEHLRRIANAVSAAALELGFATTLDIAHSISGAPIPVHTRRNYNQSRSKYCHSIPAASTIGVAVNGGISSQIGV